MASAADASSGDHGGGQVGGSVVAGDHGEQLAVVTHERLDDLAGNVVEVRPDDRELPLDHAEHVADMTDPGRSEGLLAGDGHSAVAGRGRSIGHRLRVGGQIGAVVEDGKRGDPLDGGARPNHLDRLAFLRRGACGGLRRQLGVTVVGQHEDLARAAGADRLKDLAGRGPSPGATEDDRGARGAEHFGDPLACGTGDDCERRGVERVLDLVAEVRDDDPVRTAGLDARLDGGSGVIDMDVDVPRALGADDQQGITQR